MNEHVCLIAEAQPEEAEEICIDPAVGSLLPDYIVDLLEESATERVEEHIVACQQCKEKYLTILRIRYASRQAKTARCDDDDDASNEARVLKLADFKKHQP